jgi:hypothetical protein
MPAKPLIIATGSTSGANPTPNVAEDHYVATETVTFSDNEAANVGQSYIWTAVDVPPGQTSPLVNPTTATPTMVIDSGVIGTFRIRCQVGTFISEILIAVLAGTIRPPGYLERDDSEAATDEAVWNKGGNTKGWHPAFHAAMNEFGALDPRVTVNESNIATLQSDVTALEALVIGNPLIDGERVAGTTGWDPGSVVNVSHSLGRAFLGAICTSGHVIRVLPDAEQTDKTAQVDLRVEPWEVMQYDKRASTVQNIDYNGLNGDDDVMYRFEIYWRKSNATSIAVTLRPNDTITASQDSQSIRSQSTGVNSQDEAEMTIMQNFDAADSDGLTVAYFKAARDGLWRQGFSNSAQMGNSLTQQMSFNWQDSATLLTGIRLRGGFANTFGIDTFISAYRWRPKNTSLDLWIF